MFPSVRVLSFLLLLFSTLTPIASAQFESLDAHQPPDLNQAAPSPGQGLLDWLDENKAWILLGAGLLLVVLVIHWLLNQNVRSKRLQRDALEKLRKSLLESSRATRGPAKSIWLTGSPRDPPARLGRYAGHHRSVEAVWLAYKPWIFASRRILCVNPVDLNGLDAPEIHVRAIGVNVTRGLAYAVPDVHNDAQREAWSKTARRTIGGPEAFAEAWKAYYAAAVDNALAFYDAMNAMEDRSFLRQEVTRSRDEYTETLVAPAKPMEKTEEAQSDA